jgi:hypothetical protein
MVSRRRFRYHFEGRFGQFAKDRKNESLAVPIETWLDEVRAKNKIDNPKRGGYLWQCVDNYYTAVLSGSTLASPVGEDDFIRAMAAVEGALITPGFAFALELMSHPGTLLQSEDRLCVNKSTPSSPEKPAPLSKTISFKPMRAAGGLRVPENYKLPPGLYAKLLEVNQFDLKLWTHVKEIHQRMVSFESAPHERLERNYSK